MKIALINPDYIASNIDLISDSVDPTIGNFKPIGGDLVACRGVGDLPDSETYHVPPPLPEESSANWEAREGGTITAMQAQCAGRAPTEIMVFESGDLLRKCRKLTGWTK